MTEKLYDVNSHLKEFSATVLFCKDKKAVLDKTAFFPEGGGQTSDKGYIDGVKVLDVKEENGEIYHYLEADIETGKTVDCKLDWEERFDKMQNHSGEHIISGIVHSLFGYDNVGFHLSDREMTMDFNGMLTREDLKRVEQLANEIVWRGAKFNCYYPENLENLEYRSKLDLSENVRIVEIEDCDMCACCAPHVENAGEIGIIKILDFCKNKNGIRIWAVCGKRALLDYNNRYQNDLKISSLLCVPQTEIAKSVEKTLENIESLKYEIGGLKRRLIAEITNSFVSECKVSVLFQDGFDIKELQLLSDALHKKTGDMIAVFSGADSEYSFAICGESEKLDGWFKDFKSKLNVRGGGRNGMVQGTVLNTKDEILGVINELD
ncbi:MAG: alanyl-tRNA editing protein [Clostridia bacterium]|nr:alanyl-tRNA editing protein [Clostridia bacterium]